MTHSSSRLEKPAQRLAGKVKLASRRAGGDAQAASDLFMGETFHVVQHEHGAVAVRKQADRLLQVNALGAFRRRDLRLDRVQRLVLGAAPPAQVLTRAVEADADQPGAEARLPAEA